VSRAPTLVCGTELGPAVVPAALSCLPHRLSFLLSGVPWSDCNKHFHTHTHTYIYIYIYKDIGKHVPLHPCAPCPQLQGVGAPGLRLDTWCLLSEGSPP
jgi:hypothetical protein